MAHRSLSASSAPFPRLPFQERPHRRHWLLFPRDLQQPSHSEVKTAIRFVSGYCQISVCGRSAEDPVLESYHSGPAACGNTHTCEGKECVFTAGSVSLSLSFSLPRAHTCISRKYENTHKETHSHARACGTLTGGEYYLSPGPRMSSAPIAL